MKKQKSQYLEAVETTLKYIFVILFFVFFVIFLGNMYADTVKLTEELMEQPNFCVTKYRPDIESNALLLGVELSGTEKCSIVQCYYDNNFNLSTNQIELLANCKTIGIN